MEDRKKFDALIQETLLIEFEIVVLGKTVECRVPAGSTLKKALTSLKQCLKEEAGAWYDFNEAIVMDPLSETYLYPLMTLKECGCHQGSRLLVF